MGNACGCGASEEQEVNLRSKKAHSGVVDMTFHGEVNFNDEEMEKVVKIQSCIKGAITRKFMKNGKFYAGRLIQEEGVEYKEE